MPSPPPCGSIRFPDFASWTPEARGKHLDALEAENQANRAKKAAEKQQKKEAEKQQKKAAAEARKQQREAEKQQKEAEKQQKEAEKEAEKQQKEAEKQQKEAAAENERPKKRKIDHVVVARRDELLPLPLDPAHAPPVQAKLSTFQDIKKNVETVVCFVPWRDLPIPYPLPDDTTEISWYVACAATAANGTLLYSAKAGEFEFAQLVRGSECYIVYEPAKKRAVQCGMTLMVECRGPKGHPAALSNGSMHQWDHRLRFRWLVDRTEADTCMDDDEVEAAMLNWAQCENCEKWRITAEATSGTFDCEMAGKTCADPEDQDPSKEQAPVELSQEDIDRKVAFERWAAELTEGWKPMRIEVVARPWAGWKRRGDLPPSLRDVLPGSDATWAHIMCLIHFMAALYFGMALMRARDEFQAGILTANNQ